MVGGIVSLCVARRKFSHCAGLTLSALVLLLWLLPASLSLATPPENGKAAHRATPPELASAGWRLLKVPGKDIATFGQRRPGRIDISADGAVAFLNRPLNDAMGPKRRLAWSWRVDAGVPSTDLSMAPGDDRSLAVHIVFPLDPDKLSFWERMEHNLTSAIAPPMAGKILTYVWGGEHPRGSVLDNPYFDRRGKIIVLRSAEGPLGQWMMEEIDFVGDFEKAFGYLPPAPAYLAVSADSDDTGGRSFGVVADLEFKG